MTSFQINKDELAKLDPDNSREVLKIEMGTFKDGFMYVIFLLDDGSDIVCRQDQETGLFNVVEIRVSPTKALKIEGLMDVKKSLEVFLDPNEKLMIGVLPPD